MSDWDVILIGTSGRENNKQTTQQAARKTVFGESILDPRTQPSSDREKSTFLETVVLSLLDQLWPPQQETHRRPNWCNGSTGREA
jgi:hypothetical protein